MSLIVRLLSTVAWFLSIFFLLVLLITATWPSASVLAPLLWYFSVRALLYSSEGFSITEEVLYEPLLLPLVEISFSPAAGYDLLISLGNHIFPNSDDTTVSDSQTLQPPTDILTSDMFIKIKYDVISTLSCISLVYIHFGYIRSLQLYTAEEYFSIKIITPKLYACIQKTTQKYLVTSGNTKITQSRCKWYPVVPY